VKKVKTQIRPQLIDDLMDMYVEWREACVALRTAYERWSSVRVAERRLAFASYQAALDWEEQASAIYADRVNQVARELPSAPQPPPRLAYPTGSLERSLD
jgi:hypothetical protein